MKISIFQLRVPYLNIRTKLLQAKQFRGYINSVLQIFSSYCRKTIKSPISSTKKQNVTQFLLQNNVLNGIGNASSVSK